MKMSEKRALVEKRAKVKAKAVEREQRLNEKKERKKTADKTDDIPKVNYDILQVSPKGRKYKTTFTAKFREHKKWKAPDPQEIISRMPGTVLSVDVQEGDHVTQGDCLLTIVAMKMENVIVATFGGVVNKIAVKEGDRVKKGDMMLYIKSDIKFEKPAKKGDMSSDLDLIE